MRVVPALVWARLRHRPLRALLVVLGMATATVLPVMAHGSATVVAAQALRHGIANLPAGQRSLIVSYPGVLLTAGDLAALDAKSRSELARLSSAQVHRQLLFRRIADQRGGSFFLGAADHLLSSVRITSGRAPTSCTPVRCEVVVIGEGTPALDPTLGIVIVGRAVRTDPLLLTGTFDPGHDAPLLLADGVADAQRLSSLEQFQRSYGWVTPLDLDRVQRLGVDTYVALSAQVTDELFTSYAGLVLTAPDTVLQSERDRAQLSSRRFALLSGAGTALLLGFAVIAAIGLRRDQLALVELMRRRGANRRTTWLLTLIESAIPVCVGTLLGLSVGGAVSAAMAARAQLPAVGPGLAAIRAALPAGAASAVVATVIVMVTSSWGVGAGSRTVGRVVDAAVVAGLATAALAIGRGAIGAGALAGGTDPLLTALPVIAVLCGGLMAARVWPYLAASVGRLLPRRWLGSRLALLRAARRPFRPAATVAFLTAATAIVVFAGAYRATLQQGALDQAAFAVPLDARVTTGANLERPLDVQSMSQFAGAGPGARAFPVLRSGADVRVSATESTPDEVIGVDPASLPLIRSWAHDVGGLDPVRAGRLIAAPISAGGVPIPAGSTTISIAATGNVDQVTLVAWFRSADGRDLGSGLELGGDHWTAAIPSSASSLRLIALTLAESDAYATRHQHAIGEGATDVSVLNGRMTLGAPSFRAATGPATAGSWDGWGSDDAQVAAAADHLAIAYSFTGSLVVVRSVATPVSVLPVLADPDTAARARGGLLELAGAGGQPLQLRVVGTLPRFPTVGASFVVADVGALADALDAREPGAGSVAELWIWTPRNEAPALGQTLSRPPYDRLTIALRSRLEAELGSDPLAVGAITLLTISAVLALAVAVLALVLLVVAERRDESAELYAWESDGVAPRTLRLSLFVRALAVVAVALPAGVATGLLLSRVTTTLVALTAVGTTPQPPLTLSVGPLWAGSVLAGGLLVAVAASGGVALAALRERVPRPPEEDLR